MQFGPWAMLLLAGVSGGAVTCAALVLPRRFLLLAGAAGIAAAAWIVASVVLIVYVSGRLDASIASAFIALGACGGGYALASSFIPRFTTPRVPKPVLAPSAGGDETVRVVLLADAEPESYEPAAVTATLEFYDRMEVPLPPDYARPLVYASERGRYHRAGGSPARRQAREVAMALQDRLAGEDVAPHVETAFCSGDPSLAQVVTELAADGARRIVVAGLTTAWSAPFEAAVTEAAALGLAGQGISLESTDPTWASPHITAMVAQRTLAALGADRSADGVVLVAEGEPWQVSREGPDASEQSTFFVQRVRAEMVEAGLAADRIRRAWLEWEEPDVSEAVRHLAAVGATRIALVPVTYPLETMSTLIDLRFAAERAAGETGVTTIVLHAWGDDPSVAETLREAVVEAAARFTA